MGKSPSTKKQDRYIPCFDSVKNTTWWEYYPTLSEKTTDGWITIARKNKYHSNHKNKKADDDTTASPKRRKIKDDLEYQCDAAWGRLHAENTRREELRRKKNNF
jgi:hypothetical protein